MDQGRIRLIGRWLGLFLSPGQVTACTGLYADGKGGGRKAEISYHDSPDSLAARAVQWDTADFKGIYFNPNPILPEFLAARKGYFVKDEDIVERHWLLIDCDPKRPAHTSSTEGERHASWRVLQGVLGWCEAAGLESPILSDSGNGFHVCYPIRLPNDKPSKELIRSVLYGLDKRCADEFATVGKECHDAKRIWKLYGTRARKGQATEERPHRYTQILAGEQPTEENREKNNRALQRLLDKWAYQERVRNGRPAQQTSEHDRNLERAKLYVGKEPPTQCGTQSCHNRTYHVAAILVEGFGLGAEEALPVLQSWSDAGTHQWTESELQHKLQSALEKCDQSRKGYMLNGQKPHQQTNGTAREPGDESGDEANPEEDATLADLIAINATVRWVWPGWVQLGVLTGLASEPGTGKTRFGMDLTRRLLGGLPWPDGAENTYPTGTRVLWMPADNQHAELATVCEQFKLDSNLIFLNAMKSNPFTGTSLDTDADRKDLEKRIARIKPAIVFIDTILNTTDKTAYSPEDAKALYKPLQEIAQRQQCAIICSTHLNKGGSALGRRILGQCRVVLHMDHPDKEQKFRRRLWVEKSNALIPDALGVTMATEGNEYDDKPPLPPDPEPGKRGPLPQRLLECMDWLREWLETGPKRVSHTRNEAEAKGFNSKLLYRAKGELGVEEFETEGKKWWESMEG